MNADPQIDLLNDIFDNVIKDLEPNYRQTLFDELLARPGNISKTATLTFFASKFVAPASSKYSKNYWLNRGWNSIQASVFASVAAKERKSAPGYKPSISPYSQEFWTAKINPDTGLNYTADEADFQRNSRRPIRKEYWMVKGHSEEESIQLAADHKANNNQSGSDSSKNRDKAEIQAHNSRSKSYWTLRGYSEEEAIEIVSELQVTFSLEICIEKHGEEKGREIWQARQDKWQSTLNDKPPEEIERINKCRLVQGPSVSSVEKLMLTEFQKSIPDIEEQFVLEYTSEEGKSRRFTYDFKYQNKIIEYNGDFWHINPLIYNEDYVNPRTKMAAKDKWAWDANKNQTAINAGYEVLVVWESEFKQNKNAIIDKCLDFLLN